MSTGFYEERDDLGNSADAPNGYDDAADFTFPAYDGATQDTAPLSFSETLSASDLAGENKASNPYGQFSGVLGQSGLAS